MTRRGEVGFPGKHSRSLRAIFLDFDGVILESSDIKTEAFQELFKPYPSEIRRIVNHHKKFLGVSRYKKFDYIFKNFIKKPLSGAARARLGRDFSRIIRSRMNACPLVPGMGAFLRTFSKKVDVFVVSGTPQAELRALVRKRNLAPFFEGTFGSPRTKTQLVNLVMKSRSYLPQECVFVGDGWSDYDAARKGRLSFVGRVKPGHRSPFPPRIPIVRDGRELLRLLSTWPSPGDRNP